MNMNVFRILGDLFHITSKCILIYAIHRNHSAEGVSLITQVLYCLVFITRYLNLFLPGPHNSPWNVFFKIFYILSSLYILFLMLRVYARTRERETAWKFGLACLLGSALSAPFIMMLLEGSKNWGFLECFQVFSIILESICVLPQLLLLRQTSVPTVIDSFYLITLGSYRGFYILNWIYRGLDINGRKPEPIPIVFGIIQVAFYVDFFWVYYSRQRVKLRNGGIVDAEDVRKGWILRTIFGNKRVVGDFDEDEESSPALGEDVATDERHGSTRRAVGSKWGSRGISVSADNGVMEGEGEIHDTFEAQEEGVIDTAGDADPDAMLKDPDELARELEEEDDGFDDGVLPSNSTSKVGNGSEWRDRDS